MEWLWTDSISRVGEDKSADGRLVGQLMLGGLGLVLLVAGLLAYFIGTNDKIVGGFFVLTGLVVGVLAAFFSRTDRLVELGLLRLPAGKARRAERKVEQGRVVFGNRLEAATKALEETLAHHHVAPASTGDLDAGCGPGPGAQVLLAEDAVFTMATLAPQEQVLVRAEVDRMSRPDFPMKLDPRATRPGETERSYRMHRVPDTDIRLWYRRGGEPEPYSLYVMVIENLGGDQ